MTIPSSLQPSGRARLAVLALLLMIAGFPAAAFGYGSAGLTYDPPLHVALNHDDDAGTPITLPAEFGSEGPDAAVAQDAEPLLGSYGAHSAHSARDNRSAEAAAPAVERCCYTPRGAGAADDWCRASNMGPNRPGTLVPESFDLSVAGQKFSVHPNATKHMAEYATSTGGGSVPISSLAGSVEQAVA